MVLSETYFGLTFLSTWFIINDQGDLTEVPSVLDH